MAAAAVGQCLGRAAAALPALSGAVTRRSAARRALGLPCQAPPSLGALWGGGGRSMGTAGRPRRLRGGSGGCSCPSGAQERLNKLRFIR